MKVTVTYMARDKKIGVEAKITVTDEHESLGRQFFLNKKGIVVLAHTALYSSTDTDNFVTSVCSIQDSTTALVEERVEDMIKRIRQIVVEQDNMIIPETKTYII